MCTTGTYANTDLSACLTCPAGYDKSKNGATKKSDCFLVVPAGSFLRVPSSTTTELCPKGTWKGSHQVMYGSASACNKCPEGTTTDGTGASYNFMCK